MGAHTQAYKDSQMGWKILDPGDAGAIPALRSGVCCMTSGASGETRTLALPKFVGQTMTLVMSVDGGGNIVVTVAAAFNVAANTTLEFDVALDSAYLEAVQIGTALRWLLKSNIESITLG